MRQGASPAPLLACNDSPKQGSRKFPNSGEQVSVVWTEAGTVLAPGERKNREGEKVAVHLS